VPQAAPRTASTGTGQLKDTFSRYIRRIEAGNASRVRRTVAKLARTGVAAKRHGPSPVDELVAAGMIRPPLESGDPTDEWPDIRLPRGAAAELIDADRG